jgi:hypothetical protein
LCRHYAVYVPEDVNVRMVLVPDVVTVGEPVVVPVYSAVGKDNITTPEPPSDPTVGELI